MGLEYHANKRAETERSLPSITIPLNVDAEIIVQHILKIINQETENFSDGQCIDIIHNYCTALNTAENSHG